MSRIRAVGYRARSYYHGGKGLMAGPGMSEMPARAVPTAPFRARWVVTFLVAALIVLLGSEAAVRVFESRIPEPPRFYSGRADAVVSDMDRLQANGIRSDAVLVGTSQMARGGVPKTIAPPLGAKWVQNVALPSAQTPVVQRWLLEEVVPRLHPKRVVWGVSSIDFNGRRKNPGIANYNSAVATRRGAFADANRELTDVSALARERAKLRRPTKLAAALRSGPPPPRRRLPLTKLLGPQLPKNRAPTAGAVAKEAGYLRGTLLGDFGVTPAYMNAFEQTLRSLREQKIQTAVVVMPVSSRYRASHPGGVAQYDKWKARITKRAHALGATVVDSNASMPDADFSDFVHLKPEPARVWSAKLGRALAAQGWHADGSDEAGSK